MGSVRILSHRGGALYRATPVYDFTALDSEVSKLTAQSAQSALVTFRALNAITALEEDVAVARIALNAVIQQWLDGLIRDLNDVPPELAPPTENDPETGLPWTDPADAQMLALFEAINAARAAASVSALTRNADLDRAAINHLRDQAYTLRSGHIGSGSSYPADRVVRANYLAAAVGETLAYGNVTAASVIADWQEQNSDTLLDSDYVDVGVAYVYEANYPHTHLWAAVYAQPGTPPTAAQYGDDPATQASEEQEAALNRIEPPRTQIDQPKKLGEVATVFAKAAQKLAAAIRELARLYAEGLARSQRLDELTALKTELNAVEIDIWCADFNEDLTPGQEYGTFEVPGFYSEAPTHRVSTIYEGTAGARLVDYDEQSINIAPSGTRYGLWGKLQSITAMSAAGTAWNMAMEPGHLRWKPWCRYAVITEITGDTCTIELVAAKERDPTIEERITRLFADTRLDLNPPATTLTNVPANYQGGGVNCFEVADEVLVYFQDFDWNQPLVIGFRRVPRPFAGRQGWI